MSSATNLQSPLPLSVPTNQNNNLGVCPSSKVIGPPPPVVSSATTPTEGGGFPPFRVSLLGFPPPQMPEGVAPQLRTQRQWTIYNAIQELQKKQQVGHGIHSSSPFLTL